jgi:hypothetical protein
MDAFTRKQFEAAVEGRLPRAEVRWLKAPKQITLAVLLPPGTSAEELKIARELFVDFGDYFEPEAISATTAADCKEFGAEVMRQCIRRMLGTSFTPEVRKTWLDAIDALPLDEVLQDETLLNRARVYFDNIPPGVSDKVLVAYDDATATFTASLKGSKATAVLRVPPHASENDRQMAEVLLRYIITHRISGIILTAGFEFHWESI